MLALMLILCACHTRGPPDCAALAHGAERDRCLLTQALGLPANQILTFSQTMQEIDDPVIRAGGIMHWVSKNNVNVSRQDGVPLCELLDPEDQALCLRKLDAIHLSR